MARFFVGQRVKIIDSGTQSRIGKEATIWKIEFHPSHLEHGPGTYCWLDVDGIGARCPIGGHPIAYKPEYLSPILDRHEPCEAEFKESLDELLSREVKNETVK